MTTAKKIIHVNKSIIGMNVKDGGNRPVFTIKQGSKPVVYCRSWWPVEDVSIRGVQSDKPLSCGARAWIEVVGPIMVMNAMSYKEALVSVEAAKPTPGEDPCTLIY